MLGLRSRFACIEWDTEMAQSTVLRGCVLISGLGRMVCRRCCKLRNHAHSQSLALRAMGKIAKQIDANNDIDLADMRCGPEAVVYELAEGMALSWPGGQPSLDISGAMPRRHP